MSFIIEKATLPTYNIYMHYTCIRISKGSAKKTHFFTVGGGVRLYAYSTKHLQHLSLSQIIQRISTVPLSMIRSPNHSEGGDTELCEEVQSQEETGFWRSMFQAASPKPLYSSYVGLCAVRKSSRQVLDHMFNPFPQAGCRTLCKWTHHMSNAPSQYPMCRTLEQVQAHMANISASTLPSPVHKLLVVQYRTCIYTERATTYHPGLCWSCKANPWVGIQRNMQVPLKIDWYIYCLIRTNTNCKLHRFYWLIWAKIHLFYRNISTIINNSHFVELT